MRAPQRPGVRCILKLEATCTGQRLIRTIETSQRAVPRVEKEHKARYVVVIWGLGRMLEASHKLLLLMQKSDISADMSSTALGRI